MLIKRNVFAKDHRRHGKKFLATMDREHGRAFTRLMHYRPDEMKPSVRFAAIASDVFSLYTVFLLSRTISSESIALSYLPEQ